MAGVAPAPTQTPSHVSRLPIPPGLVPAAVLLAAAVGLLALLPSLAQAVWEVPHLLLLGLVISYGVFAQRNDADAAAKESSLAWNARYHPNDPLVVVADHAAPSDDGGAGQKGAARERPLSLPVRRLKASPAAESETDGDATSDAFGEGDTDSCASSSAGLYWAAGARAVPSPPSVLDADVGLSPCSQPRSPSPSPPPLSCVRGADRPRRAKNAAATAPAAMSRGFVVQGYRLSVPHDERPWSDDDDGATDWDEDDVAEESDEMTVSSDRSGRGDFAAACANDHRLHSDGDGNGRDDGDTSVDEELFELARKAAPDGEEEVDRKADEFIAKFREQIRLQRH